MLVSGRRKSLKESARIITQTGAIMKVRLKMESLTAMAALLTQMEIFTKEVLGMVGLTDMAYTKMKIQFTGDNSRIIISTVKAQKRGKTFISKGGMNLMKKLKEL